MDLGEAISELETLYGIWTTFDKSEPGHYAMKHNQTWRDLSGDGVHNNG